MRRHFDQFFERLKGFGKDNACRAKGRAELFAGDVVVFFNSPHLYGLEGISEEEIRERNERKHPLRKHYEREEPFASKREGRQHRPRFAFTVTSSGKLAFRYGNVDCFPKPGVTERLREKYGRFHDPADYAKEDRPKLDDYEFVAGQDISHEWHAKHARQEVTM